MKFFRRLWIVVPAAILVAFLLATFLTRGSMANMPFLKAQGNSPGNLVDQRPWQTIESLAPLAVSAEEQSLAREAERLADHEVDQAFALALRQAALQTRVLAGDALTLQQRIVQLQALVKEDQAKVETLTAALKATPATASSDDL